MLAFYFVIISKNLARSIRWEVTITKGEASMPEFMESTDD